MLVAPCPRDVFVRPGRRAHPAAPVPLMGTRGVIPRTQNGSAGNADAINTPGCVPGRLESVTASQRSSILSPGPASAYCYPNSYHASFLGVFEPQSLHAQKPSHFDIRWTPYMMIGMPMSTGANTRPRITTRQPAASDLASRTFLSLVLPHCWQTGLPRTRVGAGGRVGTAGLLATLPPKNSPQCLHFSASTRMSSAQNGHLRYLLRGGRSVGSERGGGAARVSAIR